MYGIGNRSPTVIFSVRGLKYEGVEFSLIPNRGGRDPCMNLVGTFRGGTPN